MDSLVTPEPELDPNPTTYTKSERRSAWGPTALIVGMVGLYFFVTRPAPALEGWASSYDEAIAKATTTKQNLLVAFYLRGCPPCMVMDRTVLNTDRVKTTLEDYIPVRVDAATEARLADQFQVMGTPAYIVVSPQGEAVAKREGYQSVDEFVAFLEGASAIAGHSALAREVPGPDDL